MRLRRIVVSESEPPVRWVQKSGFRLRLASSTISCSVLKSPRLAPASRAASAVGLDSTACAICKLLPAPARSMAAGSAASAAGTPRPAR